MSGFFPMTDLKLGPRRRVTPAGTVLWRVHQSRDTADEFTQKAPGEPGTGGAERADRLP
ncbi:hypothetical protein AB0L14_33675 [Streptomyces sp. NPDC052727]|uniref:hypothetical protein n=2 Tax=unclassified Streptomyces TaxID=2593676 RepID=UPI003412207A